MEKKRKTFMLQLIDTIKQGEALVVKKIFRENYIFVILVEFRSRGKKDQTNSHNWVLVHTIFYRGFMISICGA